MAKKKSSDKRADAIKRVQLQTDLLKQASDVTLQVATLNAEQAAAAAESAKREDQLASDISFQEAIGANVADLAAGRIAGIGPGGAITRAEDGSPNATPEERFNMAQEASVRRDAFQAIVTAFTEYGIEGIADTVFAIMADPTIGEEQAIYKLKFDTSINPVTNKPWNEAYTKRFSANVERIRAGKPALSEGQYLTAERSYAQALRSLGVPRLATRDNFSKFIAGDVSADEVVDRVTTAVNRVQNAPQETKDALSRFYPNLSALDIAEAVLDPEVSLPALKRQIAAAEIGGSALRAGLKTTRERAEQLQTLGVTEEQAQAGYQQIAGGLQRGGQLSAIYQQSPYGQEVAEQEIFGMAGAPEARRRRQKIIKSEEATFGGQAGISSGALARDRAGTI